MRCRLAIIGLLALAPLAATVGWSLMPEPRISAANCARIRDGMALEEVECILGADSQHYDGVIDIQGEIDESKYSGGKVWHEDGREILVTFFNGAVTGKYYFERTLWERIDDWYHDRVWFPGGRAKRLEAAA